MNYVLVIVLVTSHWFGSDTLDIKSIYFNTQSACEAAKDEFNLEFPAHNIKGHAECAFKGE